MQFETLLNPQSIVIDSSSRTKTALLSKISEIMAVSFPEFNKTEIFDALWQRESLGSTAIGFGVAIPHTRLANVDQSKACFIKLQHPVDFGAIDKQPVDLIFSFIVPEALPRQHLNILAALSNCFSEASFRQCCRQSTSEEALFSCLKHQLSPLLTAEDCAVEIA